MRSTPSDDTSLRTHGWVQGRGWGWNWGAEDEIGALNCVTAASVLRALSFVEKGRVFDLGLLIGRGSFLSPAHPHTEVVSFRTPEGTRRQQDLEFMRRESNIGNLAFMSNLVMVSDHAGTQIDGLAHVTVGDDDHWYNGYSSKEWGGDFGPRRAGGHTTPPMIMRGHLIDIAAHFGVPILPDRTPIGADLLKTALAESRAIVEPGDAVFVRTGSLSRWGESGLDHAALRGPDASGLTLAGAKFLVEDLGAAFVASDTSMVEVFPPVDGVSWHPVHEYLLIEQGVHMGELHYLEELSEAGVTSFCYVALVPKLKGITAGFAMRPIALV